MIGSSGQSVDVELVAVGCTVFDCDPDVDPDATIRGGTVVAIESHVDADTGEVQRRFITAEPWRGGVRFHTLTGPDVRQVHLMDASAVRYLIRQLATVVTRSKRVMTTDEDRAIAAQAALMEALTPSRRTT